MTSILDKAKFLAINYHRGQQYGNFPYTQHLWDVEKSLRAAGADEVALACGWLHDVLEDTPCTNLEIFDQCGQEVAFAVLLLTKRKGQTLEQYTDAVKSNAIALEVKIHDTLCNLRASVMSGEKGRIRKYAKQMFLLMEE